MTDGRPTSEDRPIPSGGSSGRSPDGADGGPATDVPATGVPSGTGRTPWQHYVDLLRALDAERADEQARTFGQREGAEAAALEAERLASLLIDQAAELSRLARRLRIGQPKLFADPVQSTAGPYELVVQATRLTARAGSYAREAHTLATRARFLPGAPAGFRNAVLYLLWALLGLLVQVEILMQDQNAPITLILFLIPTLTFLAGLVSVSTLGRVPLTFDRSGRARRPGRSVRAGLLICFGIFPFVMLGYLLRHLFAG